MLYGKLIKPLLFSLPPEQAHHIVTATLSLLGKVPGGRWLLHKLYATEDPSLEREVFGIRFKNPVGMAAGFDRYGHIYRELSAMGFGFVEVGSITPKRQPGNPKPRIFRLDAARALLNRVGICSHGLDRAVAHLRQPRGEAIVGCNIGKNTATPCDQAPADYLKCFRNLYQYADYFTINVACDPGQKAASYQTRENITKILEPLFEFRRGQNQYRPIMLKVSPDMSDEVIDEISDILLETPLDGIVATNGTHRREGLHTSHMALDKIGSGRLSGAPLTQRAVEVVRRIHTRSGGNFPIIGVGGIMSPADAKAMLDAGADLLQLYTGYIYEGPGLVGEICRSLIADAEAAAAAKAAAEARAEEEARAAAQAAEAKAAAATASGAQAPEAGKAAPGTETAATAQTQAAAPAESVPNPSPETQNSPAQPADNEPDTRKKQPAS